MLSNTTAHRINLPLEGSNVLPLNSRPLAPMPTLIHPTAVIHPSAVLHPSVQVGAYAVIGATVTIGARTIVGSHVVIDGDTRIGEDNHFHTGAVIGSEPQDLKYDGGCNAVIIGNGNQIREYVTINQATHRGEVTCLGNHNLLMAYTHVGHNCILEDHVIIANSVALAGHVYIESQARISGVLGVHQFVHIGRLAMVGGMARIDRDVPPYVLVEGNPGRVRALNQVGLQRAGVTGLENGDVMRSLKKAFRALYRSGLSLTAAVEQIDLLPDHEYVSHLRQFLQMAQQPGRRGLTPGSKQRPKTED
jgi:UDP-N-acetylglucosamine acyltransferase